MQATSTLITTDEFETFLAENRGKLFQLINGEIIEKMPAQRHGLIASRLNAGLFIHSESVGQGFVAVEVLHRLPTDPYNARQPDIAYYREIRESVIEEGATPYMPDLAIEIQLLSAVAIPTGKSQPSKGFFELAKELGRFGGKEKDELDFWLAELKALRRYWQNNS